MQQASAECNATVWGKIYFAGYNNSAAINATIQIVNSTSILNSTQTDENGFYNMSISFSSPSKNIGIKMIKEGASNWIIDMNNMISINCSDSISKNYSIDNCSSAILYGSIKNENFEYINETDNGREVKIHLVVLPKDGKIDYIEDTNFTKTDNTSSSFALSVTTYEFWPMNLYLWAEPTENYYYRVYDDNNLSAINSPNYTSYIGCSFSPESIIKNFVRFPRKSVGNCNYSDECKSNICNQTSNTCQCTSNTDCADSQICNVTTNQCQNLNCIPPNGTVYNHTCVNCTDNTTCGEQFCNLTVHVCQPIYCTSNDTCRSNQFCNTTKQQCQNLFCPGNQKAFNHTCINCSFDFDKNNITDIFDAVYLLEYLNGEKKDILQVCADVDNNGIVDLFDVAHILYFLAKFL